MSVINQVLNQLEQRGAPPVPEQTMVRTVPHRRGSAFKPIAAAVAVALIAGLALWQARKPVNVPQPQVPAVASVPIPAAAPVPLPASESVAEKAAPELFPPVSRLSTELTMMPAPADAPAQKSPATLKPATPAAPTPAPVAARAESATKAQPDSQGLAGMPVKRVSPAQQADAEFRKATELAQQGRTGDAIGGYEAVLQLDAGHHVARQALISLLMEQKRNAEAERVLLEGLALKPEQAGFAMRLARLQVERGALDLAIATLEKSLPHAASQADYHAFLAALLQRKERHSDAIRHYQTALQHAQDNGIWLMGYGISLQAMQRNAEAGAAFRRALEANRLSPELQAFVRQKLKEL